MIRSHLAAVVSEQGDMQKGSFQRWCKESGVYKGCFGLRFSENMKLLALLLTS